MQILIPRIPRRSSTKLVERYWIICPLRELIMDHGAEFGAHRRDENGQWDSEFKQHIVNLGIKPILARVKHPQTNGKIEEWFDSYRRFRKFFASFDEFVDWYNRDTPAKRVQRADAHLIKVSKISVKYIYQ